MLIISRDMKPFPPCLWMKLKIQKWLNQNVSTLSNLSLEENQESKWQKISWSKMGALGLKSLWVHLNLMIFWRICQLNFRIPAKYLNSFAKRKPNPIQVFNRAMFCLWFEHLADSFSFLFSLRIKHSFNIGSFLNYMYNHLAFRKRNMNTP